MPAAGGATLLPGKGVDTGEYRAVRPPGALESPAQSRLVGPETAPPRTGLFSLQIDRERSLPKGDSAAPRDPLPRARQARPGRRPCGLPHRSSGIADRAAR
ncbi:hypothetical protein GCM10010195_07710 [Kitasatospora griseola]|nr:hypothetical protein GCM10010195_07710 [Kitasatospora griseola]